MLKVDLSRQLMVIVDNQVGCLAEVTGAISSSGINLTALCAYSVQNKGFIMFVRDDWKKAKSLLQAKKLDVRDEAVLVLTLDNKPGALQTVTDTIADAGIDITLIYGSADRSGKASQIVLITEDNKTAQTVIQTI